MSLLERIPIIGKRFQKKGGEIPMGETDRLVLETIRGGAGTSVDFGAAVDRVAQAIEGANAADAARILANLPETSRLLRWDEVTTQQAGDVLAYRATGGLVETPTIKALRQRQEAEILVQQEKARKKTLRGRLNSARKRLTGRFDIFEEPENF